MNDVDRRIRSDLDRAVSTAPPPVSVETILSRGRSEAGPHLRPYRLWAVSLAALVAVAATLAVAVMASDDPGPGVGVDVEATETPQPDTAQPPSSIAAAEVEVTVRNGLWLSETIPDIAIQVPSISENELWAALEVESPRAPFTSPISALADVDVPGLSGRQLRWEGLLAPGTYSIDAGSTAADVIEDLHDGFLRATSDLAYDQAPEQLGLSPYELVIVASLVETADPANADDRAKIATVIHNRLAQGLPVGLDSAYLYGAQDRDLTFTPALLETPGPYAIRTNPGLPPTPIATPSRASLRAAIEPTPGPWLFYVIGDKEGNYYFAATLAEHNANVAVARENGTHD